MEEALTKQMTVDGALTGVPNMADDLGERAGAGSVAAFEALVRRHDRRMLALALRLTGQLADAQDVTQDALSRLHANLHRLRSEDEVGPWLRMVTVNLCRDLARRKRRSPVVASSGWISQPFGGAHPGDGESGPQTGAILPSALQRPDVQ